MATSEQTRRGPIPLPAQMLEQIRTSTWQELIVENLIRLAGVSAIIIIALIFFFPAAGRVDGIPGCTAATAF